MDSPYETIESQIKWLKNIEAENKRMTKLVDDLLTLSRADTAEQLIEKEAFMLNEAVLESLAPFEALASEKGVKLNALANSQISFLGDKKRIKQLVVILLDNALHHTESGSVTITLSSNETQVILSVSDTGCGIEAEHMNKIFDRFYRVSKTKALNQNGTGLGLSIASWIVKEHGGQISVKSTPGTGATFTVYLPLS